MSFVKIWTLITTPHYRTDVRHWLNENFEDRWIGRAGPHEWPARSPDLTPCDFFLWGYLKEQVYQTYPKCINELELSIREACRRVPVHLLRKTCHSFPQRLKKLKKKQRRAYWNLKHFDKVNVDISLISFLWSGIILWKWNIFNKIK